MEYVVIQKTRKTEDGYITLRDKTKSLRSGYWTSVIENAKTFPTKEAADEVCGKLKFNEPRVVPMDEAETLIKPIMMRCVQHIPKRRKNIFDMSNSEYKEWLGGGNDDWHEHNGGSGA